LRLCRVRKLPPSGLDAIVAATAVACQPSIIPTTDADDGNALLVAAELATVIRVRQSIARKWVRMIDDDSLVGHFELERMDESPARIVLPEQSVSLRRNELDEGSAALT
jgi:hypothetical protein